MSMNYRKIKFITLTSALQLKGILSYLFQNLTLTNWKMSKGLFNSTSAMAKKINLFAVLTLLFRHSSGSLDYSPFVELGIRFQFEINNMPYEVNG